ncbi:kinesin-domain-containing protein [Thelephora ganbajun]|uniref:Kinesin-domain-containing protein n=1 Tax=Thelephora ganbajun TaxID=370292 RepID=A0ACB6ZSE3_THEGA|nr:kinesin-domain-containing protein [Thelephora ganbajun]
MVAGPTTHKIRIAARLRPRINNEPEDDCIRIIRNDNSRSASISVTNQRNQVLTFPFSSCYDQDATQEDIYNDDVKPLLDVLHNGVTVTIFAYGVTSSGKTHTMQGSSTQPGIIPRVMHEILHRPHPDPGKKLSFNVSYFEIYKDEVYDLLGDRETAPKLPVRENDAGQIFVANLSSLPVSTEQEFQSIYSKASKARSVGATNLNRASSRSHAILTVEMNILDEERQKTLTGKLVLVDLAGSENNKMTGNDASRMAESAAINKSLSVLGQVVHALNQGAFRIPYRNSKLTRILQDALGGTSVGLLIVNLAPGIKFRQDTLNTLNFAGRTKNIENKPVINERGNAYHPSVDNKPAPKPHFAALHQAPQKMAAAVIPTSLTSNDLAPAGPSRVTVKPPSRSRTSMIPVPGIQTSKPPTPLPTVAEVQPQPMTLEMNEQIAALVRAEVARELERQEKEKLAKEEEVRKERAEEAEVERRLSLDIKPEPSQDDDVPMETEASGSANPDQINDVLEGLLKHHRDLDNELRTRLSELERKVKEDNHLATVLSPSSKKKTGRAYVALAREYSQKGRLEISLELYRKAWTYVPDNAKLQDRIVEMEWAVKNNKPLLLSPKRAKKSSRHSRPKRSSRSSRQKSSLPSVSAGASVEYVKEEEDENEGADDTSESWRSRTRAGKRKRDPLKEEVTNSPQKTSGPLKDQLQDDPVTPPKRPRKGRPSDIVESDGDGDGDEWVPATSPRKVRSGRD